MQKQLENRLLNCVDLLLDALFLVDASGHIIYVNLACERIFGYTQAEMIGRAMVDFVHPDDRAKTAEESRHVMAGLPRVGFENRYLRKNGHIVHIMWSARWSAADQLRIGVARDVTSQKRAEERQAATYAVSEAAHQAADLDSLFRQIHTIITRRVPIAGLAVATRDPKSGDLNFPYQQDHLGNADVVDEALARHHCEEVMHSGQARLLPDGALAFVAADTLPAADSASWLILPLIAQQEAIGALILKATPAPCMPTRTGSCSTSSPPRWPPPSSAASSRPNCCAPPSTTNSPACPTVASSRTASRRPWPAASANTAAWPCSTSTSTTSSTSTTASAMPPATCSCSTSPAAWKPACARPTPSPAWGAMSSW
jgi:PAS domain S-box-containing protein